MYHVHALRICCRRCSCSFRLRLDLKLHLHFALLRGLLPLVLLVRLVLHARIVLRVDHAQRHGCTSTRMGRRTPRLLVLRVLLMVLPLMLPLMLPMRWRCRRWRRPRRE